jgi:UDP-3-O-[3-hydroxymyristoyl] glucosamine N-acyltransferase
VNKGSYTLFELAEIVSGKLIGNPNKQILSVDILEDAKEEDITFFADSRYRVKYEKSQGGAFIVSPSEPILEGRNYILHEKPSSAFQQIAFHFIKIAPLTHFTGIHPTSVVHQTAKIGKGVTIGPFVVIDGNAQIGEGSTILSHSYIGCNVRIGQGSIIHPHVNLLANTEIGNNSIIHSGSVLGSSGFGFVPNDQGKIVPIEQLGNVSIESDVDIGPNCVISRARFKSTRVKQGTKIDSFVMVGHNAEIGKHNIIISQSGIAGSSKTGDRVTIAAQVGIAGHVEIASGSILVARSSVASSIKEAGIYAGSPYTEHSEWKRQLVHIKNLPKYATKIKELEKKLEKLLSKEEEACQEASSSL